MTSAAGGLLLVGCGKMGGALLNGWIEAGRGPASLTVVEPEEASFRKAVSGLPAGIAHVRSPHELSGAYRPDVVIVAVKPQIMDEVAPNLRRFAQEGTVVLSIAAGRTIDYFQDALGKRAAIVRAMPNTAAAIGRGITAAIANAYVSAEQHALCDQLLAAVGEVVWLTDEGQMDAVTAVSGSGPAYIFLLTECMAKAGEEAGLPAALAAQLARATVTGAGALLAVSPETPTKLRQNVTSPGGTTEAALEVLMAPGGLPELMSKAVEAAAKRSHELAQ
jgi:pyrroline-5-carboxylate reductase